MTTEDAPSPTDAEIKAAIRFSKMRGRQIRKLHEQNARDASTKPAAASERDAVTEEAIKALRASPSVLFVFKQTVGKLRGASGKSYTVANAGLLDICGVLKSGLFFSIEAKRPGVPANFSAAQLEMMRLLRLAGCPTGIVTSSEEAVAILQGAKP